MRIFSSSAAVLTLAVLALTTAAALAQGPVAFDKSWKTQRFSLFSANSYEFGGPAVSISSDASVSLAYRALPEEFWTTDTARWSWAVSEGVPGTDLRKRGGDDRNISLYFVLLPKAEAERLKGVNPRRLLRNKQARVLVYVWGGAHNRGAVIDSPYLGARGKTIVLRPSGNGSANEKVDWGQDAARAFGAGDYALVGLALSGDSDDTDSRIRAQVSNLRIE